MSQRAIILLYDGVVQLLAFKAIRGRVAPLEPFCPAEEPDGIDPEQSSGRFLWVPWPFHAASSRDVAGPHHLPVLGLCHRRAVMLWLPAAGGRGAGTQGPLQQPSRV